MTKHIPIIAISTLLNACAPWPAPGLGGNAEQGYTKSNYVASILATDKSALLQQLQLDTQALLLLEQKGARECVPAALAIAELQKNRVEREINGDLLEDAYNDAVILRKQIHALSIRLDYVSSRTHCAGRPSQTTRKLESAKEPALTLPGKYLLLEVHFDTNSSAPSEAYRDRILKMAETLASHRGAWTLEISAHADERSSDTYNTALSAKRADAIMEILISAGITREKISTKNAVESSLLLLESIESARTLNRRVEIWLQPVTVTTPETSTSTDASDTKIRLKDWPQRFKDGYSSATSSTGDLP